MNHRYLRRRDGRVRFRVMAIRGDNVLGEAQWNHRGREVRHVTSLSREYFVRHYGLQPEEAA